MGREMTARVAAVIIMLVFLIVPLLPSFLDWLLRLPE